MEFNHCRGRNLLQAGTLTVGTMINTNDPTTATNAYNDAINSGALNTQLSPLGLQLSGSQQNATVSTPWSQIVPMILAQRKFCEGHSSIFCQFENCSVKLRCIAGQSAIPPAPLHGKNSLVHEFNVCAQLLWSLPAWTSDFLAECWIPCLKFANNQWWWWPLSWVVLSQNPASSAGRPAGHCFGSPPCLLLLGNCLVHLSCAICCTICKCASLVKHLMRADP